MLGFIVASNWFCWVSFPSLPPSYPYLRPRTLGPSLETVSHSTVSDVFQLNTERRAKERQEYDHAMSEREAQRARMEEQERKDREEKEKEEIAHLRQELVM